LRGQLRECAEGLGGEVSARGRAARLAETYLRLNDEGRQRFLKLIALEFGPDPKKVEKAPPTRRPSAPPNSGRPRRPCAAPCAPRASAS
jgi:hypothetical protein